ncbi:hypothetical protein M569_08415, partial [Genlisea aurea]
FIAFSLLWNSKTVLCRPRDPFNSILGVGNIGSWKPQAPEPSQDVITLVLAGNRTRRIDILSHFHKYKGGWNVSNKHYWASVGSTGAVAFLSSALWFVFFGAALTLHYFFKWKMNIRVQESIWWPRICLMLLLVFTSAAMIGTILVSVGQNEFHGEASATLNYVVNQSEYTVQILRNVTQYLSLATTINVAQIFIPSDVKNDIDKLTVDLGTAADTLQRNTNEKSRRIQKAFCNV